MALLLAAEYMLARLGLSNFFQGREPVQLLLQPEILIHMHRLEFWWASHPQTPNLGQMSV